VTYFGKKIGARWFLITAGMVFLFAWVVLDVRWTVNNLKQVRLSLADQLQTDEHKLLGSDLDGEIYLMRTKT
jgi:hypothetical protein